MRIFRASFKHSRSRPARSLPFDPGTGWIASDPRWAQSPDKVMKPSAEEAVMGPYYPRGYYTTKAEFETSGPRK